MVDREVIKKAFEENKIIASEKDLYGTDGGKTYLVTFSEDMKNGDKCICLGELLDAHQHPDRYCSPFTTYYDNATCTACRKIIEITEK